MLKKRLIGVLVVKNGLVVQSIGFRHYLPVGRPTVAVEYLNRWGIDEILLVDISATAEGRSPDCAMIAELAPFCLVPLAAGGGVHNLKDMEKLIRSGADKVVLQSALFREPDLLREGARHFGRQCMVVSIDARQKNDGSYETLSTGLLPTGHTPADLARMAEDRGAGEIFINSVDRDGSQKGYDAELISQVCKAVSVPVIACGGAGHAKDFVTPFLCGAAAAAAANYFHFTEHSVILAKRFLHGQSLPIRLDSHASYEGASFDEKGRLAKKEDRFLEKLRFEYIPEEII
ncbi:imidazole glycerol phosphate synthase subunit HisF [Desulfobotulus mexicanus]|uniref:imidazole glycerol-phosphate synthase n=1 Tax=Desulfobotulus mexicanus TaxID=2586642 RepID=A0A5Q4VF27_9BACT|nr:imidazole glycerol phosphate synthase cyclase subunit [Desulfobotulus mexicanus]TYT76299.1 imidazole glycerol phosphate synthase cyclase subunit [Desulfobotulus mexicanus]